MALETTNSNGTPIGAADTAPADGTQDPVTTSEGEQQNAFQKFLESLFKGKGDAKGEDPAKQPGDKPDAPEDTPPQSSYSEEDLKAQIAKERARWEADLQEKQRLEKLSPEERAKADAESKDKQINDLQTQLRQRELRDTALDKLEKEGYPVGLAELLNYADQSSMEKSLARTEEVFRSALEAALKERLRGKTPEGLGGAANTENAIRDQIAHNIRGGLM